MNPHFKLQPMHVESNHAPIQGCGCARWVFQSEPQLSINLFWLYASDTSLVCELNQCRRLSEYS